jgi:methionyl aminopeptidase
MAFAAKHNATPAPLNYKGFPKSLCTSINQVICHGIPSPDVILKEGDIIGVDVTLIVDGFYGDNAATIPVGQISPEAHHLLYVTLESLRRGIEAVAAGRHVGDIGAAIQRWAERFEYGVVQDFVGHGIGLKFHEEPQIPHVGKARSGPRLRPNMTFTIEPMINQGTWQLKILPDDWTAVTLDGKLSAQFEHTLAVTEQGAELLTVQNSTGEWEPPGRFEIPKPPGFVD